ncbi:MAG: hypothetical protein EXR55_01350 [Dehalococcoidia bacterium]|nr:hypothetical protein [Dehalococcoidia bacterium]
MKRANMKPLLYGLLGAGIASVVLIAAFVLIQERETPEEIAAKVAQEWTADTIDSIADAITKQVTGGVPGLNEIASGAISGQIR